LQLYQSEQFPFDQRAVAVWHFDLWRGSKHLDYENSNISSVVSVVVALKLLKATRSSANCLQSRFAIAYWTFGLAFSTPMSAAGSQNATSLL
jgi:hypothetical protein